MNRSKGWMARGSSVVSVIVGLTFLGGTEAGAQHKSLKEQLVGAWTLVSIEVIAKDGTKRPGFGGPNAKGILILDASGRYAQVTGNPDRPKASTTVRREIPTAEFGAAARTFGAGFGAWSVSEADKTLALTTELGMFQPEPGRTERKASVSVTGNELKRVELRGSSRTEFVYRRAR